MRTQFKRIQLERDLYQEAESSGLTLTDYLAGLENGTYLIPIRRWMPFNSNWQ